MNLETRVKSGKRFLIVDGEEIPFAPPEVVKQIAEEMSAIATAPPMLHFTPTTTAPGATIAVGGGFPAPAQAGEYHVWVQIKDANKKLVGQHEFATVLTVSTDQSAVTVNTVQAAYKRSFRDTTLIDKYANWAFADPQYRPVKWNEVKRIINAARIYTLQYEEVWHDCDDFAYALMGALTAQQGKWQDTASQAVFITYVVFKKDGHTYGHALLSGFDGNVVKLIEPQAPPEKAIYPVPSDWQLFLITG